VTEVKTYGLFGRHPEHDVSDLLLGLDVARGLDDVLERVASPARALSVLERRVTRGAPISVRYAAPRGEGTDRIAIVRAGAGPEAREHVVSTGPTDRPSRLPGRSRTAASGCATATSCGSPASCRVGTPVTIT
jgi:hypothetical protein